MKYQRALLDFPKKRPNCGCGGSCLQMKISEVMFIMGLEVMLAMAEVRGRGIGECGGGCSVVVPGSRCHRHSTQNYVR